MPDEQDNDAPASDAQSVRLKRAPWPPLPPPSDVEHVTMSGGLFGGLSVMRGEYIDRSRPRRSWLHRLLHGL